VAETSSGAGDVRVGLLGYGLAGAAFHAPLISATPGLALSVVVTANADRAEAVRRRYPDTRVAARPEEVLEPGVVDLVVVATPNATHVPLARQALEAGCDVVVDKPVAPTAREARDLQALAHERGRVLTVYQNRRWDTDYLTLRALLAAGDIGEVRRFESRFEGWSPTAKGGWRESGDPAQAGGLLYDLGAHLVDQAVQLFGPVSAVYAEADVRREGVSAVDDVFVALRHVGGVRSHLWMSKVAAHLGPRLRVLGSEGAFVAHGLDPQESALRAGEIPGSSGWGRHLDGRRAEVCRGSDVTDIDLVPGDYGAFYRGVEHAVRARTAPPVAVEEAAYVLDVIAAATTSARSGAVVPTPTGRGAGD
jgi:predicted dehydrogenase